MRRRSSPRGLVLALTLACVLAPGGVAAEPPDEPPEPEPALCRDALAKDPAHPIDALRTAEAEQWRAAKRAGKAAKRAMSRSLGAGPGSAPGMSANVEVASADYFESIHRAKTLCRCRLARGGAEPDECARRYPVR